MKKYMFGMFIVAMVVIMNIICSCGNGSKKQEKEQNIKDSITKVIKESLASIEVENAYIKEQSKENIEKGLKLFLSDYINTGNENIEGYLSSDFNAVIKKRDSVPNAGEWHLFGLNSSAMVQRFVIKNLTEAVDNRSKATVLLFIDNEGYYQEETYTIYMVFENAKWVVDEIDNVKKNMKSVILEGALSGNALMEESVEMDAKESLQKMLSKMITPDGDKYIQRYFTRSFNNHYIRACEKADREGAERPRIWWQYSDCDPTRFTINAVNYVSDDEAKANVTLQGDLYSGRFLVILKSDNGIWRIDKIRDKATNYRTKHHSQLKINNSTASRFFSYGTYRGPLRKGRPHGVNGRLIFKFPHLIDSRDPKGRVAEAGDYVIGEWSEGHLVQGVWYGADNRAKGSILIGK